MGREKKEEKRRWGVETRQKSSLREGTLEGYNQKAKRNETFGRAGGTCSNKHSCKIKKKNLRVENNGAKRTGTQIIKNADEKTDVVGPSPPPTTREIEFQQRGAKRIA